MNMAFMNVQNPCSSFVRRSKAQLPPRSLATLKPAQPFRFANTQPDGAPDYEFGGQEFESLRARQHLAPIFRAKNTAILRNLQGTNLATNFAPNALVRRSVVGAKAQGSCRG